MSLRYPILAGARESNNAANHISSYDVHGEQDISRQNIDKDTTATNSEVANVLPPEIYAGILECKFIVSNHIV